MKIITLAKTKELLGITDSSLDDKINRYIPIIDSKVKQMTKNQYNWRVLGDVTISETEVPVSGLVNVTGGIQNYWTLDDVYEYLEVGMLVSGTGIPDGTYIDAITETEGDLLINGELRSIVTITLSAAATETTAGAYLTLGFNIGNQPLIAKGIAWMIGQEDQTMPGTGVSAKSIGTVSITYSGSQAKLDGRYGMPQWFVNGLPKYMGGY